MSLTVSLVPGIEMFVESDSHHTSKSFPQMARSCHVLQNTRHPKCANSAADKQLSDIQFILLLKYLHQGWKLLVRMIIKCSFNSSSLPRSKPESRHILGSTSLTLTSCGPRTPVDAVRARVCSVTYERPDLRHEAHEALLTFHFHTRLAKSERTWQYRCV